MRSKSYNLLTVLSFVICVLMFASACSIQEFVIDEVSNALTGSGNASVFLGDNDPQLVADALPFAIKLYESLLGLNPDHDGLSLTTGSLYVTYAGAFIQTPASMFELEEFEQQQSDYMRARNLYIRGRDILASSINRKYPGLHDAILNGDSIDEYFDSLVLEDIPLLYWYISAWIAPITIDSFDMSILLRLPAVVELLAQAYALNPEFNNGAFEELYIAVYAALPEALGGGQDKSIESFERAIAIQEGKIAGPYVSLATSVALPRQDKEWFIELIERALSIDPDDDPDSRLLNTITQRRARWLLANIDDYFI